MVNIGKYEFHQILYFKQWHQVKLANFMGHAGDSVLQGCAYFSQQPLRGPRLVDTAPALAIPWQVEPVSVVLFDDELDGRIDEYMA